MKNLLITGIGGKVGKYVYELASDYSFNVVRMDFSTSGTTGQTFMRAFYSQSYDGATDANSTRHIPVMIAQPSIFNTGFLVYELRSATFI